jgi:hypothetical protein
VEPADVGTEAIVTAAGDGGINGAEAVTGGTIVDAETETDKGISIARFASETDTHGRGIGPINLELQFHSKKILIQNPKYIDCWTVPA